MKDLECPYCEMELEICHDDGFGYEEGVKHQMECPHCGKSFVFETSVSFYYEPEKADCLNDGNHNYKKTCTYPKEFSRMKCTMCDDERELTDEEKKKYGIGSKEDYFKILKTSTLYNNLIHNEK
jgi:hypothetical protein